MPQHFSHSISDNNRVEKYMVERKLRKATCVLITPWKEEDHANKPVGVHEQLGKPLQIYCGLRYSCDFHVY